jgi:DNA-binding NarL/FixJ family response regulator
MNDPVTILIADDHPLFRSGLRQIIEGDKAFNLKYELGDGEEVLNVLQHDTPDIAVLDVDMPKVNGLEVARVIRANNMGTEIIFLTMYKEEDVFNKAMDIGARGYVLKESAVNDIIAALRTVAANKYYVSPVISEYLVRRAGYSSSSNKQKTILDLTPAERRVMLLIAEHKTNNDIADELKISPKTVARHRENVANKLNLHGNYALLKFVLENKDKL